MNRRQFLKLTAGAAIAGPSILRAPVSGAAAPGGKLNIAAIGTGGRGSVLIEEALRQGENIVALCNVDQSALATAARLVAEKGGAEMAGRLRLYDDYRKLLDAEKSLDAVLIATGSRWHVPLSVAFMKAGKHVFTEKPLIHKLAEARELAELARTCKVATQTGTQGGSLKGFRRSVEAIQSGLLGQVRAVHLWCDGYGPNPPSHDRPPGEDLVPAGFDWDFWLGPAPLRPFKKGIYHPGALAMQNWFDLCNGMVSGQGAHTFYLPVVALRLRHPIRVEVEIPEPVKETYVSQGSFHYEFPARGEMEPVTVWWTDGGKYPPPAITETLKAGGRKVPNMGCLFIGDKGELFAGGWGENAMVRLKDERAWRGVLDHDAVKSVPETLPRVPGDNHMSEWLAACKGGPTTFSNFERGAQVAAAYLPAILALRLGRPIEWDGEAMKVKDAPEADRLIQKTYRKKWMM